MGRAVSRGRCQGRRRPLLCMGLLRRARRGEERGAEQHGHECFFAILRKNRRKSAICRDNKKEDCGKLFFKYVHIPLANGETVAQQAFLRHLPEPWLRKRIFYFKELLVQFFGDSKSPPPRAQGVAPLCLTGRSGLYACPCKAHGRIFLQISRKCWIPAFSGSG